MKYSLPCPCGKTVAIEVSQAGQRVNCACGQQLEVPTMREIRQLPPLHDEAKTSPPRRLATGNWSVAQRLVFSFGLAVCVLGFGIALYFQSARRSLPTQEEKWDTQLDTHLEMLENMDLEDAWGSWLEVREGGIGQFAPPRYVQARIISDWWKDVVFVGLGIGVVGLVLIGIAFVLPRQRPRTGKPPRATPSN
jgi:hypothetical protein